MTPEECKAIADEASAAWNEVAPLLHPAVAQYLHALTAQVFWLHKEVARLQDAIEDTP